MNFRRFFSFLLSICLIASIFTGITAASADDNVIIHTVQNGEYLFKICKAYGLDYYQCKNAIMALNGFTNETQLNRIAVGQTIKLPANNAVAATTSSTTTTTTTVTTKIGDTTTTTTTSSTVAGSAAGSSSNAVFFLVPYVVKSGDTLNKICSSLGTSYFAYQQMILGMNGIKNDTSLQAGKTIYIPVNAIPQSGGQYYSVISHTVKNGENMTSICGEYGVNFASKTKLVSGLNSGKNLNKLLVGESVYIPVAGSATTSVPASASTTSTSAGTASVTPSVPTYEINMGEVYGVGYHGYPYATVNGVNVSKAAAGTTVTINGNADNGYALQSITVKRLDSLATIPTKGNTFTMPASAVKVEVNYKLGYKLTKTPTSNGTFDVYVNGAIADYALEGDKITISASPNYTYVANSVTTTPSLTIKRDSINNYSFKMPANDVTVNVAFSLAATYTITTNKSRTYDTVQYGSVEYTVDGTPADKVAEGSVVTMNFTLPKNVIVKTITVKKGGGVEVPFKRVEGQPKWYFTMPSDNVTVDVEFSNSVVYKINTIIVSDDAAGKATGTVYYQVDDKDLKNAVPGQTVKIVVNPKGQSKCDNVLIRFVDGTTNVICTKNAINMYEFTMPESSVNVYVHFNTDAQKYTVYNLKDVALAYVTSFGEHTTSYEAGWECNVIPQYDEDNYKLTGVYWRDSSGVDHAITENPAGSGKYPFTMPAYNVGVYATVEYFETWAIIELAESTGVKLYLFDNKGNPMVSGTHVKSGSTITVQAIVDEGYVLDDMTKTGGVNDMNGSGTTYTYLVSPKDHLKTIKFASTSHAE